MLVAGQDLEMMGGLVEKYLRTKRQRKVWR
jgi:hypothetical protein